MGSLSFWPRPRTDRKRDTWRKCSAGIDFLGSIPVTSPVLTAFFNQSCSTSGDHFHRAVCLHALVLLPFLAVLSWWFCSVTQLCPALCGPMGCSMPSSSILCYLPEFAQTSPLSRWCCLTISSSAAPIFCLQSFPASGSCFILGMIVMQHLIVSQCPASMYDSP